jgi:hypothetical protein
MAQPKVRVGTEMDSSGIQKGIDASNKQIQNFANKTEDALRDLGSEALGATGPFKRIAEAMLGMGPAGAAVTAITVGVGSVITILDKLRERQIAAAERQNALNEAFRGVTVAQITAAQGGAIGGLAALEKRRKDLLDENAILTQKLAPAFRQQANIQSQINDLQEQFNRGAISKAFFEARTAQLLKQKEAVKAQADFSEGFIKLEQNRAELAGINAQSQMGTVRALTEQKQLLEGILKTTGSLTGQQRQALDDTTRQLRQIAMGQGTPEVRLAAMATLPEAETAADRAKRAEEARLKVIRETKAEFDALFSLTSQGYVLSTEQQAKLMDTTKQYAAIVADTTKSIEERTVAAQALATIEKDSENRRNEAKRLEDEAERNRKKIFDEAIVAEEQRLNNYALLATAGAEAFELMFSVIGQGGNALKNLGRGFIQLTSGLAKSKAAENIAYAIENFAKAIGFTATGEIGRAAAAKKSAVGHLKAAAGWSALAGASAAAGTAASGGGGATGEGTFNNSQLGRNNFNQQQPLTIVIQGGLLDMSNPDTQRSFVGALETVTSRRITINRVGA